MLRQSRERIPLSQTLLDNCGGTSIATLARGSLSLPLFLNTNGIMVSSGSQAVSLSPSRPGRTGAGLGCRWVFLCGGHILPAARHWSLWQGVVSSRRFPFSASFPLRAGSARQGPFSAQEGSACSATIVSMGLCGASGRGRPGVGRDGRSSPSYPPIEHCLER